MRRLIGAAVGHDKAGLAETPLQAQSEDPGSLELSNQSFVLNYGYHACTVTLLVVPDTGRRDLAA